MSDTGKGERAARYQVFFEALADPAFVIERATGTILEVNAAAARAYGYPRDELCGLSITAVSTRGERALQSVRDGRPLTAPRLHRRKDGTTFLAEISLSVVDWDGREALIGVVRDVTVLSNAFHTSPLLMSVADLQTDHYLEVNDTFCKRVGFTRDEMIGRTAVELGLITPAERDALAQALMASNGGAIELVLRSREGTSISCRYWGQVLQAPDGLRLFGAAEDVTERRRADAALAQSNERFRLAMDATTDGLWDWNVAADTGYFSPGYYRMLGYEPDEFPANSTRWRELMHPDDRAVADQANLDCIEGRRERFEVEFRMKAKDGEWRWVLGRGKCLARDANGRATRLLGTHVDITERKRLHAGLAQNDRLANMGMLAAGIAHEINNPLSYVLASLDTLARDLPKLPPSEDLGDLVECAQSAREGTQRIQKIARGLSTFARVERVELDAADLNVALEAAAAMAHNEVKYRATLVKDLAPLPPVLASDGKLAQVFLNLIINAAHAIGEGDVEHHRITLRTWATGHDVFAEVADTGHGIAPEHLERIFEPFFTTKKVGDGSGLGLSISRSIVTECGGDISVESEPGKGSRFIVRLPVSTQQATPTLGRVARPTAPKARGRLLVVDDEEAIRRVLTRVLGGHHDVVSAGSGREARTLLERDAAFDLVLCDLMMPDLTGMELHAWLVTANPALARRVVFMSGGAFTPSAGEYLARVDNLKLDKPFDLPGLIELADRFVLTGP